VACDSDIEDGARLPRRRKACASEMLGAAKFTRIRSGPAALRQLAPEVVAQRRLAFFAQSASTFLDESRLIAASRSGGTAGGENGNTCKCVSPHASTRSSEPANNPPSRSGIRR